MNELMHYGTKRHSGRYPWGSGEDPFQHEGWSLEKARSLKKAGLTEAEIAKAFDMSTSQLRAKISIDSEAERAAKRAEAVRLMNQQLANGQKLNVSEIARQMNLNESSVRYLLDPAVRGKEDQNLVVAKELKNQVGEGRYLDIGPGTELELGTTRTRLDTAVAALEEEGYKKMYVYVDQLGTGHKTTVTVLVPPGTKYSDVVNNKENIHIMNERVIDADGSISLGAINPKSVDSNRIKINYAEEGGIDKDGVIELRRGVDDISLGKAMYAQVRIAVDGTHYLKGMAMYKDDMPEGVDIIYNTNKKLGTPPEKVFKEMKTDSNNPFGASIRAEDELKMTQRYYTDKDGNKQQSCINIVNEQGDWGEWSKNLASQMLSKQPKALAERQLNLAYREKKQEFEEINQLTNPTVKKKLMDSFADDCDASAVHLKAAALPRQATHVILPFPDMKETEIYAPNYKPGEKVVLIRYPHGGKFEIPELTVNNRVKSAKSTIPNAPDAVGISSKVAERLSGADFDGDSVLVIPVNKNVKVSTSAPLKGLKDFDPKTAYPGYPGMKVMKPQTKQREMGIVTNLITDMTLKGATEDEIARAVRHSMVVIDAEKHKLNYKQSEIDNGIKELKAKYQAGGGASTLISRAKSEQRVPARKAWNPSMINPETGEKIYKETGESYVVKKTKKDGTVSEKTVYRTDSSTKMAEAKDARSLVSDKRTPMELVYADYANSMKALANEARKSSYITKPLKYSPEAKKEYAAEVSSLKDKLQIAQRNAPRERKAQILANEIVNTQKANHPELKEDKDALKKVKGQALTSARAIVGAGKERIEITDREWEAIQKGAVSNTTLTQILNNTDLDDIKRLATPRESSKTFSDAQAARIKAMSNSGYTQQEIADLFKVSTSTINKLINQ